MVITVLICTSVFFQAVASFATSHWWVAPLVGLAASPGIMALLRYTLERGTPPGMFNPKTQSWAFLFGDLLFLPFALAMLALGAAHVQLEASGWVSYESGGWQRLCFWIGLAAGFVFNRFDAANYSNEGSLGAIFSPTKLAHDFIAYPVLVGSLLFLAGPLVREIGSDASGIAYLGLALAGALGWVGMAVRDMVHPPRPYDLHPAWDRDAYRPLMTMRDLQN